MSTRAFKYIYYHIVHPPMLPQHNETEASDQEEPLERGLYRLVSSTLEDFASNCPPESTGPWNITINMLNLWMSIEKGGTLCEDTLRDALSNIRAHGAVALHIRAQNCGWLAYYDQTGDKLIFDAFEASPRAADVLSAEGSLLRQFPGLSVAVPACVVDEPKFCSWLAGEIGRLSSETVDKMVPTTRKAGAQALEERDTIHPGMVTENLMIQLLARGIYNNWPSFDKHMRDEVNWRNSRLPWRRSPLWFVIRVTLQTVLQRAFGDIEGHRQYKNFMLYLVAQIALNTNVMPSTLCADQLQVIRFKIARRISKLDDKVNNFVAQRALSAERALKTRLADIQMRFRESDSIIIPERFVCTPQDFHLTLSQSTTALAAAMSPGPTVVRIPEFDHHGQTRDQRDHHGLPIPKERDLISVLDFERWVEYDMGAWAETVIPSGDSICAIADRFGQYDKCATELFAGNPEAMSVMRLTQLELWVTFDRMCTAVCPLLKKYSPEIPVNFLEPLLLPHRCQMRRAKEIENYIRVRHRDQRCGSIYRDPGSESFAVSYYELSVKLPPLRQEIEQYAQGQLREKEMEWNLKSSKYRELYAQAAQLEHDMELNSRGRYSCVRTCRKCSYVEQAEDITIESFEWPLPNDGSSLRSVLFELVCPHWFAAWRDLTWKIVQDFGRRELKKAQDMEQNLLNYSGTHRFAVKWGQRLTLGSKTKSWRRTHYNCRTFPVDFQEINRPYPFQLRLLDSDSSGNGWVTDQTESSTVKPSCTLRLPQGRYSNLQYAVDSFRHTQNQVLADQAHCHQSLSLHEFVAFGCLRAGERVQWLNIVRELASPALSLNEESVGILIRQAAWELGTPSKNTELREAHRVFEDRFFSECLLETLERRLDTIEANWNEHHTLETLIVLALRTLSLSEVGVVVERAAAFLCRSRQVTMQWIGSLITTLDSQTGVQGHAQQQLLVRVGGICQLTYAVESHLVPIILRNTEDLFHLIRASVIVFESMPPEMRGNNPTATVAWVQTSRILHRVEARTRQLIQQDASGLNYAIQESVPNTAITTPWSFGHGSLTRWAINHLAPDGVRQKQQVRYDLLSGELLVDNSPPSRLPESYTQHPTFRRLFGLRTLTVLPSNLPGSRFMSARPFEGYQVHFGIEEDRLVITAQQGSQVLRFIPYDQLIGDFPKCLLLDYAHWLNLEDKTLEFRPVAQAWQSDSDNWRLSMSLTCAGPAVMMRSRCTLVDIHSQLFVQLSKVLVALDKPDYMIAYQTAENMVVVELARLRLRFFVNREGMLEAPELQATVDRRQDIGCFYGLKNKLILRDVNEKDRRSVLIPYGDAQLSKKKNHTVIRIEPPEDSRNRYFQYFLDGELQELRGSSDMLGTLYQAYMHALTGFVLEDPATHRSGTAEALRILRQARLRSSLPLERDCIELLGRLAAMTPRRKYYPSHLRCMQTIEWNSDLGELAQHDDFQFLVQEIVDHAQLFSMLHDVSTEDLEAYVRCYQNRGEPHLIARARLRHAQFYPAEFGGSTVRRAPKPSAYSARDRGSGSERSNRVYEIASLVRDWPTGVPHCSDFYATISNWECIRLANLRVDSLSCNELLQLSFRDAWGALYELCRSLNRRQDSYSLMSLFCTIAFRGYEQLYSLRPLLAVAFSARFADLAVPGFGGQSVLYLQRGEELIPSEIADQVSLHYTPFRDPPHLSGLSGTRKREIREERERYLGEKENHVRQCLDVVTDQWPCERPQLPDIPRLDRQNASEACALLCTQWYQNRTFLRFLREVQARLEALGTEPDEQNRSVPPAPSQQARPAERSFFPPSLLDLLRTHDIPTEVPPLPVPLTFNRPRVPRCYNNDTTPELDSLISEFCGNPDPYHRELGEGLRDSLEALEAREWPCSPTSLSVPRDVLERHCRVLTQQRDDLWDRLHETLTVASGSAERISSTLLWPHISVLSVLSLLVADQWWHVPDSWKSTLLAFAQSVTSLRRSKRLLACYNRSDTDGFYKEAETVGSEGWDTARSPEWLLLEIENNITIRVQQAEVAQRMICPDQPGNAVSQLNMGEGKTTVITPMVALNLANGSTVPRIIVLKPLLRQSLTLLTQVLGRILNRPIYHFPFSRDTPLDKKMLKSLRKMYEQCQKYRGVLIALPEHILSFRLVGLDLIERTPKLAQKAINLETWLQDNCRNLIDESDEVLDPKFQLVYAIGSQQSLDGHSDRWQIVQSLLSLVEQQATELHNQDPSGISVKYRGARYPIIQFLRTDRADTLMSMVLSAINKHGLNGLPLHLWSRRIRQRALNFICFAHLMPQEPQFIRDAFGQGTTLRKLLVLRGLLAHGILRFALAGKRWLVDYGLHPSRCMMAVPFRAKGIPSEHAEFGHPDVAIILTCLSYYYHGLNPEQVRICFMLLGKENDPEAEYQGWICRARSTLTPQLQVLTGVNLEDTSTFMEVLYPHLHYQKGLVDFYLSRVVFPKEAKEFPHKLCTSAWDLPSKPDQPLTTGFSGTNDNRFLLPRSAPQRDLPQLLHTNALVLSLLLREENRRCIVAEDTMGLQLQAEQLLDLISQQNPPIRVIIDVGAQILELSNQSVAYRWLSTTASSDVEAAIFFDERDEVTAIDREGHCEKLISSAFKQRMGSCLIFLDQQHSRGVDLKIPADYRAAVLLGPRLPKDKVVQACNRMRGLGQRQSVTFVIPPEVSHSMPPRGTSTTSLDVIRWALTQTCNIFQSLRPLWALQGLQYHRHQKVWDKLLRGESPPREAVQDIQELEARTLSQLYAPWDKLESWSIDETLVQDNPIVKELLEVWRGSGHGMQQLAPLHEEQERQISHEVQREHQICRPPRLSAVPHHIHEDVRYFVTNGKLPDSGYTAVQSAFEIFRHTSAGQFGFPTSLAPNLCVTQDYSRTVQLREEDCSDEFLKPAHWVLANTHDQGLLLLSQYEVNELLPDIRSSQKAKLLIYTPKTTRTMRSFEPLNFLHVGLGHTIPRQPQTTARDLGLFAGTLYYETFSIYESLRHFLGLVTEKYRNIPEDQVTNGGFVNSATRQAHSWPVDSPFQSCPLQFLGAILDIRCKSHGYLQTHAGTIVEAMPLTAAQF